MPQLRLPGKRLLSGLAGLTLALGALAGCGGGDDAAGDLSGAKPPTPGKVTLGPDANGVEKLDAAAILVKAREAALKAGSVHFVGSFEQPTGLLQIDTTVKGTTGSGTITVGKPSAEVRRLGGDVYLRGNDDFNQTFGDATSAAILKDKWIGGPAANTLLSDAAKSVDLTVIVDDTLAVDGTLVKGAVTTFAGAPAIELRDDNSYLYVALEGRPYPLAVRGLDGKTERVRLSAWGKKVTVERPADFVDVAKLKATAAATPTTK